MQFIRIKKLKIPQIILMSIKMTSTNLDQQSEYKRQKNECCIVFDYVMFAGLHLLGGSYLYDLISYTDATNNPEFMNATKTQGMSTEYLLAMVYCMYSMLAFHMIYLFSRYYRHALGITLSCLMLASLFLYVFVYRMITYSCRYRPLLSCSGETDEYNLNDEALNHAARGIEIAFLVIAVTQVLFVIGSMVKNRIDRIYYFSEEGCSEFLQTFGFYYMSAVVLALIPMIVFIGFMCLIGGGNSDASCSSTDAIYWNGVFNGNYISNGRTEEENKKENSSQELEV